MRERFGRIIKERFYLNKNGRELVSIRLRRVILRVAVERRAALSNRLKPLTVKNPNRLISGKIMKNSIAGSFSMSNLALAA